MNKTENQYISPLSSRYASGEMTAIFSDASRYGLWRRLWAGLAREEMELGLPISEAQVRELEAHLDDLDFGRVAQLEKELRHDVMAHLKAYGEAAPSAAGIIHLGATSCFVTDNADLILTRKACGLLLSRAASVLGELADFARRHAALPCLGWTHLQPAQLTTVGKRATLWAQDLMMDAKDLMAYMDALPFRGAKGTTGTQASFLELFDGDFSKVRELDRRISKRFGFAVPIAVSGQTYTRKLDEKLMGVLCGLAGSAAKFATDMRLLMHMRELEEPFESGQVGSSAMAYKRNPMRSERICSLARFLQTQHQAMAFTVSSQWLERTLDDSACRRLVIPESFMAADAILRIWQNVASGIVVHDEIIRRRVADELPFMATEKVLMECVKRGGDRQKAHEAVRSHSMEVRAALDRGKGENDLVSRLRNDPVFAAIKDDLQGWMDPARFTGAASMQVDAFLAEELLPAIGLFRRRSPAAAAEPMRV